MGESWRSEFGNDTTCWVSGGERTSPRVKSSGHLSFDGLSSPGPGVWGGEW